MTIVYENETQKVVKAAINYSAINFKARPLLQYRLPVTKGRH